MRTSIGDEYKALAIGFEAIGAQRSELQALEIVSDHLDAFQFLTIGMQDGDGGILGAVGAGIEGHTHFVAAGLRKFWREGDGFLAFAIIVVTDVASADVRRVTGGVFPHADLLRDTVIDDDAGQV